MAGIAHMKLKTSNILVDGKSNLKLSDIGAVNLKIPEVETSSYNTSDSRRIGVNDFSGNVWLLGCILYELCYLQPPHVEDKYVISESYSSELKIIINDILNSDNIKKPTCDALLYSALFKTKAIKVHQYENGDRYEGEWENGMANGKEVKYYADIKKSMRMSS